MNPIPSERWLPIPGHDGYEVSDLGHVRSLSRMIHTKDGRTYRLRGRSLRTWPEHGYPVVRLGAGRQWGVHRLVLLAFVGPCPDDMEALHANGDPSDSRLVNLRWGTAVENMADKLRHGTNHEATKRSCPRGHPLTPPNLVPSNLRQGNRACRACDKARAVQRRQRECGLALVDLQAESDRQFKLILAGRLDGRAGRKILNWGTRRGQQRSA